jgi:tetratricopeptide (TPR) repeat protein
MRATPLLTRCARRLAVAFSLAVFVSAVHADALQEADKLLKQGQRSEALNKVDQYLSNKPKDASGRFLKGLILSEMNRQQDAIEVFKKLTDDYPEQPEPYNNLAVIYAQQKQYEKAKEALEMAIRTHPSYATAHENLGDIYARLASQAYDKALQLDSSNASAQSKLAMIRELMGANGRPLTARTTAGTTVALAAAPHGTETKSEAKAETKADDSDNPPPAEPTPVAATAAPLQTASIAAVPLAGEVAPVIEAWAAAWSKKDVKAYLAFYAKDFATPGNTKRSAWESQRRNRIAKPGTIQVSFEDLRVSAQGTDRAVAKFRQHYRSAAIKTSSNKVLVLVKRDGKWLIQQERVGT